MRSISDRGKGQARSRTASTPPMTAMWWSWANGPTPTASTAFSRACSPREDRSCRRLE